MLGRSNYFYLTFLITIAQAFLSFITIYYLSFNYQDETAGSSGFVLTAILFSQVGGGFVSVISGYTNSPKYLSKQSSHKRSYGLFWIILFFSVVIFLSNEFQGVCFFLGSILSVLLVAFTFNGNGKVSLFLSFFQVFLTLSFILFMNFLKLNSVVIVIFILFLINIIAFKIFLKKYGFLSFLNCLNFKFNSRESLIIIGIALYFSLTNILVNTFVIGDNISRKLIFIDKIIGSLTIAASSYFMQFGFSKSSRRPPFFSSVFGNFIFTLCGIFMFFQVVKGYNTPFFKFQDIEGYYLTIILICFAWSLNFHISKIMRLTQFYGFDGMGINIDFILFSFLYLTPMFILSLQNGSVCNFLNFPNAINVNFVGFFIIIYWSFLAFILKER